MRERAKAALIEVFLFCLVAAGTHFLDVGWTGVVLAGLVASGAGLVGIVLYERRLEAPWPRGLQLLGAYVILVVLASGGISAAVFGYRHNGSVQVTSTNLDTFVQGKTTVLKLVASATCSRNTSHVDPGRKEAIACEAGAGRFDPCFLGESLNVARLACYNEGPWRVPPKNEPVAALIEEPIWLGDHRKQHAESWIRPWALEIPGKRCLRTFVFALGSPRGTMYECFSSGSGVVLRLPQNLKGYVVGFPDRTAQPWTVTFVGTDYTNHPTRIPVVRAWR